MGQMVFLAFVQQFRSSRSFFYSQKLKTPLYTYLAVDLTYNMLHVWNFIYVRTCWNIKNNKYYMKNHREKVEGLNTMKTCNNLICVRCLCMLIHINICVHYYKSSNNGDNHTMLRVTNDQNDTRANYIEIGFVMQNEYKRINVRKLFQSYILVVQWRTVNTKYLCAHYMYVATFGKIGTLDSVYLQRTDTWAK